MTAKWMLILGMMIISCTGCTKRSETNGLAGQPEKINILAFGGIPGSGGQPSPTELAPNAAAVDRLPVQGFVFNLTHNKGYFADKCMTPDVRYVYEDVANDVALMNQFDFKSKKQLFTRIDIAAELQTDWFDDAGWEVILNNIHIASRASANVGATGFCLDNEHYNYQPFNYTAQANRVAKSFREYEAQTRKRGRQFAEQLTASLPNAVFIIMFGNSHIAKDGWEKENLSTYTMGLWPAFLDGLMDGAPAAEFIDGHEDYGVRTFEDFARIRRLIKEEGAVYSADPERYRKTIRASSSIWLRKIDGMEKSLDYQTFDNNNYTPEEFEHAIHYALLNSDGWIWLYAVPWLDLPQAYLDAVDAARRPHRPDYAFRLLPQQQAPPSDQQGDPALSAKGRLDADDNVVFEPMRRVYQEVYDFPVQWKFRFDPQNSGVEKHWYEPCDPKEWVDIEIRDWYNIQLDSAFTGYVWYQTAFDAPTEWDGKKLLLAFGAVDEMAWVWVNGKKAGEQTIGPSAWNSAFEIDISDCVQVGKKNTLAVRIHNSAGPGGIWKGVKIFSDQKEPSSTVPD